MRVVAILQARMGSTRLPGKSLLPLAGKPMVQNIIERVERAKSIDEVVLSVPQRDASELAITCNGKAWLHSYVGDEADLVGRYLAAAQSYCADIIVRIPCDNPCVDPAYIDEAVDAYLAWPHVFVTNTTADVNGSYVDGIGAEVLSMSRLKWLDTVTKGVALYREHPHRLFADVAANGEKREDGAPTIRLDVNTQADYEFIKDIYDGLGMGNTFTTADVLAYLDSNP